MSRRARLVLSRSARGHLARRGGQAELRWWEDHNAIGREFISRMVNCDYVARDKNIIIISYTRKRKLIINYY